MVRVAICEDDVFFQQKEKELLDLYFEKGQIDYDIQVFESGNDLLENFRNEYNVVFLDISLDGMNGIEVARQLRERRAGAYIVFLTAYVEYSLEGYKVDAHRYLLKDDKNLQNTLFECMDSITSNMNSDTVKLNLKVQGSMLSVVPSKILFVESKGHRLILHVIGEKQTVKEYSMYNRLDNLQSLLHNYGFLRIHQSYLVNGRCLNDVCRYRAKLSDGTCLGISKKYYKDIEEYFVRMRGEF